MSGDSSTPVTSWSHVESLVASGQVGLVRHAAADFRCPVLGNPQPDRLTPSEAGAARLAVAREPRRSNRLRDGY